MGVNIDIKKINFYLLKKAVKNRFSLYKSTDCLLIINPKK